MRKRYKINFTAAWYKDNPLNILNVTFGEVISDYPDGWVSVVLFRVVIGKFEVALCLDKN